VAQVDLKSQVSAPLSHISATIGMNVYPGQIIAELQNADIRAQLDQARASLAIAESQQSTSKITYRSSRNTLIDKIRDSYASALQVLNTYYTGKGNIIELAKYVAERRAYDSIVNNHITFTSAQSGWKKAIDALGPESSDQDVVNVVELSREKLNILTAMLDIILVELNEFNENAANEIQDDVDTWKTTATAGRVTVSTMLATLVSAESSFTGADVSQSDSSRAQIAAAQAGVRNLEAQLAKTIIRSPISGKIAALPLRTGELATPGQLIATIVGSGGMQIKAFASSEDITRIQRGARVTIGGSIPGTVESVAPSVNPLNRKVEVVILVSNPSSSGLVVGQNVEVSIEANTRVTTAASSAKYLLPMQNIKIVPGDAYVLTVDGNSKIQKHSVTLGEIRGEFVEIKSGLTDDMQIVSPVYELNPGETVRTQ
jgi:RND family efflux transporter MFP subunit